MFVRVPDLMRVAYVCKLCGDCSHDCNMSIYFFLSLAQHTAVLWAEKTMENRTKFRAGGSLLTCIIHVCVCDSCAACDRYMRGGIHVYDIWHTFLSVYMQSQLDGCKQIAYLHAGMPCCSCMQCCAPHELLHVHATPVRAACSSAWPQCVVERREIKHV